MPSVFSEFKKPGLVKTFSQESYLGGIYPLYPACARLTLIKLLGQI